MVTGHKVCRLFDIKPLSKTMIIRISDYLLYQHLQEWESRSGLNVLAQLTPQ